MNEVSLNTIRKYIEFNAKEYIRMSAPRIQQTKFPRNNPSLNPSEAGDKSGQEVEVAGNQSENVGGAKTVNAGQIGMNTMAPFTTSCQSESKNISHSSETTVMGLNILLGQGAAGWSTAVQNGIINLRVLKSNSFLNLYTAIMSENIKIGSIIANA